MKRILILSETASVQDLYNRSNLNLLLGMGCRVHIGCNFRIGNTTSGARVRAFADELDDARVVRHQIDYYPSRNPFAKQTAASQDLERVFRDYKFDLIHCFSEACLQSVGPLAKKSGIPVIFTSYSLPVFKGVSLRERIKYAPKLKKLSAYADTIVCCCSEDYHYAKAKLSAKHNIYIPGIGIDPYHFRKPTIPGGRMRELIEIPQNAAALITVGGLTPEKNHEIILKAVARLRMLEIHYVICGAGPTADHLYKLTRKLRIEDRVHFAKNRDDIVNMLHACDIFCLPSKKDGPDISALAAMEAGLPLVTSNIQGMNDFMEDGKTGFTAAPDDLTGIIRGIEALIEDKKLRREIGAYNREAVSDFFRENTERVMEKVYIAYMDGAESDNSKKRRKRRIAKA